MTATPCAALYSSRGGFWRRHGVRLGTLQRCRGFKLAKLMKLDVSHRVSCKGLVWLQSMRVSRRSNGCSRHPRQMARPARLQREPAGPIGPPPLLHVQLSRKAGHNCLCSRAAASWHGSVPEKAACAAPPLNSASHHQLEHHDVSQQCMHTALGSGPHLLRSMLRPGAPGAGDQ